MGKSRLDLSALDLKLLAMAAMLVDHMGYLLFPTAMWMRYVGRLAFPIFAFLRIALLWLNTEHNSVARHCSEHKSSGKENILRLISRQFPFNKWAGKSELFVQGNDLRLNQSLICLLYTSPSPRDRG